MENRRRGTCVLIGDQEIPVHRIHAVYTSNDDDKYTGVRWRSGKLLRSKFTGREVIVEVALSKPFLYDNDEDKYSEFVELCESLEGAKEVRNSIASAVVEAQRLAGKKPIIAPKG